MAYKKYIYRKGKKFGPYYYESYRDANGKVRKKYKGTKDPDKVKLALKITPTKKNRHLIPKKKTLSLPTPSKKLLTTLGLVFLFIALLLSATYATNTISGYAISEPLEQEFKTEEATLEIKQPAKNVFGKTISKNKNKKMEFNLPKEKITLYFDLLNYSEFVEEVAITSRTNNTLKNTTNIPIETIPEPINQTQTEEPTNDTIKVEVAPETNETTDESPNEPADKPIAEPTEKPVEEITDEPVDKPTDEPIAEPTKEVTPEPTAEPTAEQTEEITGEQVAEPTEKPVEEIADEPVSEPTEEPVKKITDEQVVESSDESTPEVSPQITVQAIVKGFIGILGRVIGIDSLEPKETISQTVEFSEVKEEIEKLDDSELKTIEENSKVELEEEDFQIIVNESESQALKNTDKTNKSGPDYKWGYQVKLKDLKFMAKIDITANSTISVYNQETLMIGRNLLSFSDLAEAGYKIRFEKPLLEIETETLKVEVPISDNTTTSTNETTTTTTNNTIEDTTNGTTNNATEEPSNNTVGDTSNNTIENTISDTTKRTKKYH